MIALFSLELLVSSAKADLTLQDTAKNTALHLACSKVGVAVRCRYTLSDHLRRKRIMPVISIVLACCTKHLSDRHPFLSGQFGLETVEFYCLTPLVFPTGT